MKCELKCQLCHSKDTVTVETIGQRVVYRGKYIYVAVDISPLCVGHVLIVTNEHYFNFYETDKKVKEETFFVKERLKEIEKQFYHKNVLFFEHGSIKSGEAGSSVEHAHLHVVPCDIDIKVELDKELGEPINCDILKEEFLNISSYIYLEDSNHKMIYPVDKLPSQYLRKIVGEKIGNSKYDWHVNSTTEDSLKRLEETYQDLKGKIK